MQNACLLLMSIARMGGATILILWYRTMNDASGVSRSFCLYPICDILDIATHNQPLVANARISIQVVEPNQYYVDRKYPQVPKVGTLYPTPPGCAAHDCMQLELINYIRRHETNAVVRLEVFVFINVLAIFGRCR